LSIEKEMKNKKSQSLCTVAGIFSHLPGSNSAFKNKTVYIFTLLGGFWLDFNYEKKYTFYDPIEGCSGFYGILRIQEKEMRR
jgi:hypothetical protein